MYEVISFSTSSQAFAVMTNFHFSHSDRLVVIAHCGFNSRFLNGWRYRTSFHVFIFHLRVLFSEMSLHIMEINKDQPHDKSKGYLFWAHHSKKVRPSSLAFWQRLKGRQSSGGALYGKKGRLQIPVGVCGPREAVGRMTWSRASMWLSRGHLCFSLVSPKLEAETKIEEAVSY